MIRGIEFRGDYFDFGSKYCVACRLYLFGKEYRRGIRYKKGKPRFMILAKAQVFIATLRFAIRQHVNSTD